MPKVSVIIPAYNADKFIGQTIQSVRMQSFRDWELLVVNDGSSDQTEKIVSHIQRDDDRIQLITQSNQGVSIARNTGISNSKGEYLAFLDADDIWDSDFLSKCVSVLDSYQEFYLVHTDLEEIDEKGDTKGVTKRGKHGNLLYDLLEWRRHIMPPPSGILVRKQLFQKIAGFDSELSNNADQEFYFRAAKVSPFYRIPQVLLQYRVHANNMHMNIQLLHDDTLRAYKKAESAGLFESQSFKRKCFSNMYLILALNFLRHENNVLKFTSLLLRSLWTHPLTVFQRIRKLSK